MKRGWIGVTERYPALGEMVLVWFGNMTSGPYMDLWQYTGQNRYFRPLRDKERVPRHERVTHWHAVPAPPAAGAANREQREQSDGG